MTNFPTLTYISTIEFPALFIYLETENAAFLPTGNYTPPPPLGLFPGTWYLGFLFLDLTKSHNSPIKASRAVFWSMSCYEELKLIIKLFTGRTRCGKIFMEIFWSMLHFFFAFFSGVLNWIELILVWFERSFHLAQARLTIKTDDITSGRRDVIRTHGNFPRRRS